MSEGDRCVVFLRDLRPTQAVAGMLQVWGREEKIRRMTDERFADYLSEKVVSIVVGPGGGAYLIDRQHLALAMLRSGRTETLFGRVVANLSSYDPDGFWNEMERRRWVYLRDEEGRPIHPSDLPTSLSDMVDDPYRSLAWAVRERGGFRDVGDPFLEFTWANFFRERVRILPGGMSVAVESAVQVAAGPDARGLPGYVGEAP
jgi:hypothetical protein